jgi:hypothetical protein
MQHIDILPAAHLMRTPIHPEIYHSYAILFSSMDWSQLTLFGAGGGYLVLGTVWRMEKFLFFIGVVVEGLGNFERALDGRPLPEAHARSIEKGCRNITNVFCLL